MPTLNSSGTQTAVISTEHTLLDSSANKWFSGYIDLTNMATSDTTEIRVYIKVNSSGSAVLYRKDTYNNAQTDVLLYLAPLPSDLEYKVTLKQTAGTGRNYDYRFYEA